MSSFDEIPAAPFLVWAITHEIHALLRHPLLTQALRSSLRFVLPEEYASELVASLLATTQLTGEAQQGQARTQEPDQLMALRARPRTSSPGASTGHRRAS